MSPPEINHLVAKVLGEALEVVRKRGFDLVALTPIDWDATDNHDRASENA